MEQNGWTGRTVTLKYKLDTYQGMCPFQNCFKGLISYGVVFTRAKSFDRWVSTKEELYNVSGFLQASSFFD
jgi:DNA polymerase kappa